MKNVIEALCWAALIMVLALVMKSNGASDGVAIGVIAGVAVAAIGSISRRRGSTCKGRM